MSNPKVDWTVAHMLERNIVENGWTVENIEEAGNYISNATKNRK